MFLKINVLNPKILERKVVTQSFSLGGGGSIIPPPPSIFYTIHPIDMKLSSYNKLHLYFKLSETTWYLIGFHVVQFFNCYS